MKTVWIDEITHAEYTDYDEARDAVLEHLNTDDYYNALEEVLSEHGIGELLEGLIRPYAGIRLYEKIMNAADQIVLRNFLVEVEVEEDEEDEEI